MTGFLEMKASRRDYGLQFEILVSLLYHQLVSPTGYVIDGGANAGLHAVPLASRVSSGHLKCFEPNPQIVLQLISYLANSKVLNRCSIHAQALGDHDGIVEFMIDENTPALSHIRHEQSNLTAPVKVPVIALDTCVGVNPIEFIKLDLEGADFLALKGGKATIRKSNPVIVFENSRAWAAKCYKYTKDEFFGFFNEIEYEVFDLHGTRLTPDLWDEEDLAFEFFAGHRNDQRLANAKELVDRFWSTIKSRPDLEKWEDCVRHCRDPLSYLQGSGF